MSGTAAGVPRVELYTLGMDRAAPSKFYSPLACYLRHRTRPKRGNRSHRTHLGPGRCSPRSRKVIGWSQSRPPCRWRACRPPSSNTGRGGSIKTQQEKSSVARGEVSLGARRSKLTHAENNTSETLPMSTMPSRGYLCPAGAFLGVLPCLQRGPPGTSSFRRHRKLLLT